MLPRAFVAIGLFGLIACGTAYALSIQIANLEVKSTATVLPRVLPEHRNVGVTVESNTQIGTTDGSTPPTLRTILFVFDKHGSIDTAGLPVCTMAKLAETTTATARARCPGAIVGTGLGQAIVNLPGQAAISISSPVVLFNAPPAGGAPSLIAHAYETVPAPKALLVPFSIERIHRGRYGYRVEVKMPEIADGYGAVTLAKAKVGVSWKRGGETHSYISARCEGGRLQAHGTLNFADGSFFQGTLAQSCAAHG
jgi:hypothetical protein